MNDQSDRLHFAIALAEQAGQQARKAFLSFETLAIESKGHQDLVSNADREVEIFIRGEIARAFPDDGIVGEEGSDVAGTSGHHWVIDPIDGTANFVRGIPAWCVVLASTFQGRTEVGVICEPSSGETFWAARGQGTFVNGKPVRTASTSSLTEGSIGTGFSNRAEAQNIIPVITEILNRGGIFFRNASGALMLAYVASGRLLGYVEEHMNAWDCVAGLLMIEEAGGRIHQPDPATVLAEGTLVLAAGDAVYDEIEAICARVFTI